MKLLFWQMSWNFDLYSYDITCIKLNILRFLESFIYKYKLSFYLFCGYSDWYHMVGYITKLHIPPTKPLRVIYRNLKNFDQNIFKEQVNQIPFHICSIFDDVSDKCLSRNLLFSKVLDQHAPLKTELSKRIMCLI